MTWYAMTRAERIEAVRPLLNDGKSSREIAVALGAETRNVIVGFVHRNMPGERLRGGRHKTPANAPAVTVQAPKPVPAPVAAPPPRPKPPAVIPRPLPEPPLLISILAKSMRQCAYILGPINGPDTICCGRAVVGDSSWCAQCSAKVFQPLRPAAKKAKVRA